MREIEFRGKILFDNEQGKWITGDLEHFTASDGREMVRIRPEGRHKEFVIPKTVGQWTGLLDKGFHRVYEGDVVDAMWDVSKDYHHIGVVKYSHECALFGVVDSRGEGLSFENLRSGLCTIIGNVFDSPELREIYGKYYFKDK